MDLNTYILLAITGLVGRLVVKVDKVLDDHEGRIRENEKDRLLRAGKEQVSC